MKRLTERLIPNKVVAWLSDSWSPWT